MDLNYMLGILHILILVVSSWAHTTTPDDALIIEYDKPDFQASQYQAIYNKTRNEYVTNKQRMFDVAQDFKEAKAAYTAAVNAQLGQAVDNDGNVIHDKCSWFSYVARDESCKPTSGLGTTATVATTATGSVVGFAILKKLLDGACGNCCGAAVGGAIGAKAAGPSGPGYGPGYGYGYGYGGRGYRDYSQTMGSHTIEAPILPVADITKTPIKKKKKKRKQIWLVCMVLLVIIIIGVICFALLQDNE